MSPEHPERMDLLRKYAAIYGRFDSKRKNEKPMSLHEVSTSLDIINPFTVTNVRLLDSQCFLGFLNMHAFI